ncbi:glycerophosphodiester phosphodiesterase family protein [Roseofilum casamattae]|uniref:glycerophosphodiester phosphodiesterase n=1 Tax=Roseofilum casamattae BLCC-M143 TaxID=3022442 RepID=A0ABT7BS65_9CYAN|nr:glycerophosphodiester phosphodiesterase family protein [Roseofilum casamattae]MDJ1182021.1 glycerophosphodiester phosphodiesterase family protein [Roseofilum casamattae BLCC-M143]
MSIPQIIAHRGASGYLPEHTLGAYELAIAQNADAIELDIVPTKDGELVVRHDCELSASTNINKCAQFNSYYNRKTLYNRQVEGWFTTDLTLAQIKQLRAIEPWSFRSQLNNDRFSILTLREVLEWHKKQQRAIALYIEIKHPHYFRTLGLLIEENLANLLHEEGYNDATSPLVLFSFEPQSLIRLRQLTEVRILQVIAQKNDRPYDLMIQGDPRTYEQLLSPAQLPSMAEYASGVAIDKRYLWSPEGFGLIDRLHQQEMTLSCWTFRKETHFVLPEFNGDLQEEYRGFMELGVDGIITDVPDTAVQARQLFSGQSA